MLWQAAQAGLPKPPEPVDNSDDKLRTEQLLLQLLQAQQAGNMAKTEAENSNLCSEDQLKRYHHGVKEQLVSAAGAGRGKTGTSFILNAVITTSQVSQKYFSSVNVTILFHCF